MIQLCIGALMASCGFAILFHIKGINIIYAAIGGMLGGLAYQFMLTLNIAPTMAMFFGSIVISAYAEVMARIQKVPVTLFLATGLIPLVPGGGMYRCILGVLRHDMNAAINEGMETIFIIGALVLGILVVTTIVKIRKPLSHYA